MVYTNRHTSRRRDVDYSRVNYFFVTICTLKYGYYFERYPELKEILRKNIDLLTTYYKNIDIKNFVIMPNHVHLLIQIKHQAKDMTLGKVIATLKSKTVNDWLKHIKTNGIETIASIWQRNYHEHIIRNKIEYLGYSQYIDNNPQEWIKDRYHVSVK